MHGQSENTRSDPGDGVEPTRAPLRRPSSRVTLPGNPSPLCLGSLLVLILIFVYKVVLFWNLEYYGSDMYSFLRMTWSWFHDGVPLYDNVYGYHAAIHGFYILIAFFPFTLPFGAYGLFMGLFLVAGIAVVSVARMRSVSTVDRFAMEAAILSPLGFWVLDHPQWGFHPELLYPYFGVLFTVALIEGRRGTVIAAAAATCLVKEDGAVVCASILISTFSARILLGRYDPANRRAMLRQLAVGLATCIAVFIAGLAALHAVRYLVPSHDTQLLSTVRVGEALEIARATVEGTGNPEWGERLRKGMFDYAFVAFSFGILLGRRCLAYLLVVIVGAAPVVVVLVVSSAPYGFGNLFWPPRVATLLACVFGAMVAVVWAGGADRSRHSQTSVPARFGPGLALPLVLVAASWSLQLCVLRFAADYSFGSRLDLVGMISGERSRSAELRPEELRFVRCLAHELPDRFRVSSHGPQSPAFHRQDLSFPGIESRALRPPEIRVTMGPMGRDLEFKDGFHLTIGRLAVSGRIEAEQWVGRCVEHDTFSATATPAR